MFASQCVCVCVCVCACVCVQTQAAKGLMCSTVQERVQARMLTLLRLAFAAIKRDGHKQQTPCGELSLVASLCAFFQACCAKENVNLKQENIIT